MHLPGSFLERGSFDVIWNGNELYKRILRYPIPFLQPVDAIDWLQKQRKQKMISEDIRDPDRRRFNIAR